MSRTAIRTTQLDRDESDWAAEMSPADRFIAVRGCLMPPVG